jgi:hypothetical protein
MSGMQGETNETQQPTPEMEKGSHYTNLWTTAITAGSIGLILWKIWQLDGEKLWILHVTYTILQQVARITGAYALIVEQYYYNYVATLH